MSTLEDKISASQAATMEKIKSINNLTDSLPVCQFFLKAFDKVVDCGYYHEIDYVRKIAPLKDQTILNFYREYVWVILNCGFKEQYARVIFDKFWEANDEFNKGIGEDPFLVIKNKKKRKAIIDCFAQGREWFAELQSFKSSEFQIAYIRTLPWMGGEALGYHLARNLGIDAVKPDRHLKRLAEHFGYSSPFEMCKVIQEMVTDEKLGTIDVILWRYMNLTGGKIE